ncbi:hypothetical protein M758_3G257000 [Ceratodon purpureus]|nr:hypothetical protein M758_3G257000 [Ceratodon purpureus]
MGTCVSLCRSLVFSLRLQVLFRLFPIFDLGSSTLECRSCNDPPVYFGPETGGHETS